VRPQPVVVSGMPMKWKAGDVFEASVPPHELHVFGANGWHDLRYKELSLAAKAVIVKHPKQGSSLHALRERFCAPLTYVKGRYQSVMLPLKSLRNAMSSLHYRAGAQLGLLPR
jgi:hypothetical protein